VAQKNNPNVSPQKKKELVSDEVCIHYSYLNSDTESPHKRRLYLTSRTGDVDPERLNGRCYVRYLKVSEKIEKWLQYDDHFYLNQKGDMKHGLFTIDKEDLERCEDCFQIRIEEIKRAEELLEQNRPLRGLELFSGKFLCFSSALFEFIISRLSRCWWARDWYGHVGICRDEVGGGVFSACC
jgi:hypothetical protein